MPCVSCGSQRVQNYGRPAATDNAAWAAVEKEHDMPCRWVRTRGHQLRAVFTLLPHNGTRRTATVWCVGQLASNGEFIAVSDPLPQNEAEQRASELRQIMKRYIAQGG